MKHRKHIPEKERAVRSRAAKLMHDNFVAGSLVQMARTCGKANCKCRTGEKHLSWYLSIKDKGQRKMICIPRQYESEVSKWVNTYKEITKQIDAISESCFNRLTQLKGKKKE